MNDFGADAERRHQIVREAVGGAETDAERHELLRTVAEGSNQADMIKAAVAASGERRRALAIPPAPSE